MLSQEEAARLLGMKTREVVDVVESDDGCFAQLHDDTVVRLSKPVAITMTGVDNASAELERVAAEAAAAASHADVPDGTVDEVLAWVDRDAERALLAFDVENSREKPRSTLLAKLEELVTA